MLVFPPDVPQRVSEASHKQLSAPLNIRVWSVFDGRSVKLHRAVQAGQEVRHRNGINIPSIFKIKHSVQTPEGCSIKLASGIAWLISINLANLSESSVQSLQSQLSNHGNSVSRASLLRGRLKA